MLTLSDKATKWLQNLLVVDFEQVFFAGASGAVQPQVKAVQIRFGLLSLAWRDRALVFGLLFRAGLLRDPIMIAGPELHVGLRHAGRGRAIVGEVGEILAEAVQRRNGFLNVGADGDRAGEGTRAFVGALDHARVLAGVGIREGTPCGGSRGEALFLVVVRVGEREGVVCGRVWNPTLSRYEPVAG